jgi:hypothetical protein
MRCGRDANRKLGKYVQADGYAGLDKYLEQPGVATRVGCLAHCR